MSERPEQTVDLAIKLQCDPSTIRKWIIAKKIGGYKFAGKWWTWRSEVAKMIHVPGDDSQPEQDDREQRDTRDGVQHCLFN